MHTEPRLDQVAVCKRVESLDDRVTNLLFGDLLLLQVHGVMLPRDIGGRNVKLENRVGVLRDVGVNSV